MVQKSVHPRSEAVRRRRGRPRAFEPETALTQAMDVFWKDGLAATSLDDVSAATGLNRPSLYGAFGDKRALYLLAYGQYRKHVNEAFAPLFAARKPLRVKLRRILHYRARPLPQRRRGAAWLLHGADGFLGRDRRSGNWLHRRGGDRQPPIARSGDCSPTRARRANSQPMPTRAA